MKRCTHLLAVAAVLLLLANTASASTMTFATFADPSGDSANPLFQMTEDLDLVSGGYSGLGLTLQIPFTGEVFNDVTFDMPAVAADPLSGWTLAPGVVQFFDGQDVLLTITFQSARLTEFSFGARNTVANPNNVDIVYSGFTPDFELTNESFAFSFTNFDETTTPGWITTTASFTSAAIPEPATVVFLVLGCLAMIRLRRR
jgi:hypothetical protein